MKKLLIIGAVGCLALGTVLADGGTVIRHLADTYLQSDGTQYIDLDYYANPNTRVEITFEPVTTNKNQINNSDTRYIFGSASSSGSDFQDGFYVQGGTLSFVCGDVWGSSFGLGTGIKATRSRFTAILDIKGSKATLKSGNSQVWTKAIGSTRTKTDNLSMLVFANRKRTTTIDDYMGMKLYAMAIYDDDTLVRDLVPYGRGAVTGLLDRVSGKVFTKASGNDFVLGTDDAYIASDRTKNGGQWLDTGFSPGPNTKIEVDFACLDAVTVQQRVFSTQGGEHDGLAVALYVNGGTNFAYTSQNNTGSGWWRATGVPADTERHVFTLDNPNSTVALTDALGNTLFTEAMTSTRTKTDPFTLRLFGGIETNGTGGVKFNNAGSVRIYGCKIWDGGTLVRDYSPRIVNGEAGLYDSVNSTFYGAELAKPSSALSAGGAIVCSSASDGDAYIEATGDQYIDTGYLSKRSSRIETSFLLSQRTGTQYIFGGINKTDNTWAVAENLGLYFQLTSGKFAVAIRYWNGSTTKTASPGNLDPFPGRIDVTTDLKNAKGYWTIGGAQTTKDLSLPSTTDNPAKMQIFARNGAKDLARMCLYSFAIYENDVIQHRYYPCATNGVAGLWDAEEKKFLANAKTADGTGFTLHGAGTGGSGMAFTEHPQSCSVKYGESATLSAFAPGAVGYLWLKNGEIIEGATGRTLEVAHSKGGRTDTYQCLAHYNLFGYGLSNTASIENVPKGMVISFK